MEYWPLSGRDDWTSWAALPSLSGEDLFAAADKELEEEPCLDDPPLLDTRIIPGGLLCLELSTPPPPPRVPILGPWW